MFNWFVSRKKYDELYDLAEHLHDQLDLAKKELNEVGLDRDKLGRFKSRKKFKFK